MKRTPCVQSILRLRQFFMMKCLWYIENCFNKSEYRLREIFGTGKTFGNLHIIVVGYLFQMAPVRYSHVFKDDFKDYGPLSTNLWKDHFYICHRCRNWGTKDTWWSMCARVREIGWECQQMHRQVSTTLLHMCKGFSHLNEEADDIIWWCHWCPSYINGG